MTRVDAIERPKLLVTLARSRLYLLDQEMSLHWSGCGFGIRRGGTPPNQCDGVSDVFVEINCVAIGEVFTTVFVDKLVFIVGVLGQATSDCHILVTELFVFCLRGLLSREGDWADQ